MWVLHGKLDFRPLILIEGASQVRIHTTTLKILAMAREASLVYLS